MKFKIPLTFSSIEILKRKSAPFIKLTNPKESKLDYYLEAAGQDIDRRHYLSICYRNLSLNLLLFFILTSVILIILRRDPSFTYLAPIVSILISGFVFLQQVNYPKSFVTEKTRAIEKNLISALQDMVVQLNSGVSIFEIMVNVSNSDYDEVSDEFKKITKEINSGTPQVDAIEKYGKINTSEYFKRVLWQISNGMRAGSDIGIVLKEGIKNLSAEQSIQIQSYGNKLNPIIMFYMLIAVIVPSLGITFLIIISSILAIPERIITLIFLLIFILVTFIQIMFIGLIKSRRPSLL